MTFAWFILCSSTS